MKQLIWLLAGLSVCGWGCGQSSPTTHTSSTEEAVPLREARRQVDRHARDVEQGLDALAADVEEAIHGSRDHLKDRLKQETKKHSDQLSEFAAKMAEDAKDRAIDIPEMVDMMFDPPKHRRHNVNRRNDDDRRDRDSDR